MKKTSETVNLKLAGAIVWNGVIQRTGSILEDVPEDDAKRLLSKGKATVATADDIPKKPAGQVDGEGDEGGEGEKKPGTTEAEQTAKKPAAKKATKE